MRGFLLVSGLAFLFCTLSCNQGKELQTKQIFRYNEASGISTLDPAYARVQGDIWAVKQLYTTLIELDSELLPRALLAKSWEIDSTGTLYSFHLRSDVSFTKSICFNSIDSTRTVVAQDVVYSLERLRNKELATPGSWVLNNVNEIWASSDSLVHISLKEVFPPFLSMLSMAYCSIIPQEAVEFYKNDFSVNPIGSGPFYLKKWLWNEKLVMRRNPNYFERDEKGIQLPYIEAIAIQFLPDRQSAFLELLKGEIDFLSGLDVSYIDELLDQNGELNPKYENRFILSSGAYLNTEYLGFSLDSVAYEGNHPLLDPRIRKAINFGFDRKEMLKYLRKNVGIAATAGLIPPSLKGSLEPTEGYHFDPLKTQELLVEAGFPKGEGLPVFQLHTSANYLDLCEYIQSSLAKQGIKVQVDLMPAASLREGMANSKLEFFRASWIADYPDAQNYLSLLYSKNHSPNGPNYTHYYSPAFDILYERANRITDQDERFKLYQKMDSMVLDGAPMVLLYYDKVMRFYDKKWKGLEPDALNTLDLKRVYSKENFTTTP